MRGSESPTVFAELIHSVTDFPITSLLTLIKGNIALLI